MKLLDTLFSRECDTAAGIGPILEKIMRDRRAGLEIDYDKIELEHRELMPALGTRLRHFRNLDAARLSAIEVPDSAARNDETGPQWDEDLHFLRHALTGYEILERVEYGGQGIVYKAEQAATRRTAAIKLLLDGPLASDRQRYRFAREVELISRLHHPNIVTVYESGVIRGRMYFAMEFVEGLPIDDYVILNGMTVREIVGIFRVVCNAVGSAHEHGIIHRDVKPANILVDEDGQPHILDFGLAKDISADQWEGSDTAVTTAGQVIGTLPYLSPEQARGAYDQVDVRSDVYSLGIVLFELITSGFPYPVVGDRQEVLKGIVSHEPLALSQALSRSVSGVIDATDVNDDLEKILLKALEKEPLRRYQSVAEFHEDLGRYLARDVVQAKAHSRVYLLRKALHKFRLHVAISSAFVMLLLGALGVTVGQLKRAERLANHYRSGLHVGLLGRLGGVERDAGRLDRAENMLAVAVQIAELVPASDIVARSYLYDAHHKLAEVYYETGNADKADPICDAAVVIAERRFRDNAEDPEGYRVLGFSHILRGRQLFARKEWEGAQESFRQAVQIRRELLALDAENTSLRSELAFALEWLGTSKRRLALFAESMQRYEEARAIYQENSAREPGVAEHAISASRVEIKIAVCHEAQSTDESLEAALRWLASAEDGLANLRASGKSQGREWAIEGLLQDVRVQREWTSRRIGRSLAVLTD